MSKALIKNKPDNVVFIGHSPIINKLFTSPWDYKEEITYYRRIEGIDQPPSHITN